MNIGAQIKQLETHVQNGFQGGDSLETQDGRQRIVQETNALGRRINEMSIGEMIDFYAALTKLYETVKPKSGLLSRFGGEFRVVKRAAKEQLRALSAQYQAADHDAMLDREVERLAADAALSAKLVPFAKAIMHPNMTEPNRLIRALQNGASPTLVKLLVIEVAEEGNLDKSEQPGGKLPLELAVEQQTPNHEIIELMLKKGADARKGLGSAMKLARTQPRGTKWTDLYYLLLAHVETSYRAGPNLQTALEDREILDWLNNLKTDDSKALPLIRSLVRKQPKWVIDMCLKNENWQKLVLQIASEPQVKIDLRTPLIERFAGETGWPQSAIPQAIESENWAFIELAQKILSQGEFQLVMTQMGGWGEILRMCLTGAQKRVPFQLSELFSRLFQCLDKLGKSFPPTSTEWGTFLRIGQPFMTGESLLSSIATQSENDDTVIQSIPADQLASLLDDPDPTTAALLPRILHRFSSSAQEIILTKLCLHNVECVRKLLPKIFDSPRTFPIDYAVLFKTLHEINPELCKEALKTYGSTAIFQQISPAIHTKNVKVLHALLDVYKENSPEELTQILRTGVFAGQASISDEEATSLINAIREKTQTLNPEAFVWLAIPLLCGDERRMSRAVAHCRTNLQALLVQEETLMSALSTGPDFLIQEILSQLLVADLLQLTPEHPDVINKWRAFFVRLNQTNGRLLSRLLRRRHNERGHTIAHLAVLHGTTGFFATLPHQDLIAALKQTSDSGKSPLQAAALGGHTAVFQWLQQYKEGWYQAQTASLIQELDRRQNTIAKLPPNQRQQAQLGLDKARAEIPTQIAAMGEKDFGPLLRYGISTNQSILYYAVNGALSPDLIRAIRALDPLLFEQCMHLKSPDGEYPCTTVMGLVSSDNRPLPVMGSKSEVLAAMVEVNLPGTAQFLRTLPDYRQNFLSGAIQSQLETGMAEATPLEVWHRLDLALLIGGEPMFTFLQETARPKILAGLTDIELLRRVHPTVLKNVLQAQLIYEVAGAAQLDDIDLQIYENAFSLLHNDAQLKPRLLELLKDLDGTGSSLAHLAVAIDNIARDNIALLIFLPPSVLMQLLEARTKEGGYTPLHWAATTRDWDRFIAILPPVTSPDDRQHMRVLFDKRSDNGYTAIERLMKYNPDLVIGHLTTLKKYDPVLFEQLLLTAFKNGRTALGQCLLDFQDDRSAERLAYWQQLFKIVLYPIGDDDTFVELARLTVQHARGLNSESGTPISQQTIQELVQFVGLDPERAIQLIQLASALDHKDLLTAAKTYLGEHVHLLVALTDDQVRKVAETTPQALIHLLQVKDRQGETLLHHAVREDRKNLIMALKDNNLPPADLWMTPNAEGNTPAHLAAQLGRGDFFYLIPELPERLIFSANANGKTIANLAQNSPQLLSWWLSEIEIPALTRERNWLAAMVGEPLIAAQTSDLALRRKLIADITHLREQYHTSCRLFEATEVVKREAGFRELSFAPMPEQEVALCTLSKSHLKGSIVDIPSADETIDSSTLLRFFEKIKDQLPEGIQDDQRVQPRADFIARLTFNIQALSRSGATNRGVDKYGAVYKEAFANMVRNVLRHAVKYLEDREKAIQEAPAHKRAELEKDFLLEIRDILVNRIGVSFFHCQDRTAMECDNLWTEKLDPSDRGPATTGDRIAKALLHYRRRIFADCLSRVPSVEDPATTSRYYSNMLGEELGLGVSKLLSEDADLYSTYRTRGYEEAIRREFWAQYTPQNVERYLTEQVNRSDKALRSDELRIWFGSHFKGLTDEELALMDESPLLDETDSWRPGAIALLCDVVGIYEHPPLPAVEAAA